MAEHEKGRAAVEEVYPDHCWRRAQADEPPANSENERAAKRGPWREVNPVDVQVRPSVAPRFSISRTEGASIAQYHHPLRYWIRDDRRPAAGSN